MQHKFVECQRHLPQSLTILVDYMLYHVGVAVHECLKSCVCVVRLNMTFCDDIVDCATYVRIGSLLRASLTQLARVFVETYRR